MGVFLQHKLDYLQFLTGAAFALLAALAFERAREQSRLAWRWFAWFCAAQCAYEWIGVVLLGVVGVGATPEGTLFSRSILSEADFFLAGFPVQAVICVVAWFMAATLCLHRWMRSQDNARLRATEETRTRAFALSPVAMAISTLEDGRYVEVNDTFLRRFGYAREEVIGRAAGDLGIFVQPQDRQALVSSARAEGAVYDVGAQVRTKSGELRYGSFSAEVVELQGERLLLTAMIDITERRKVEEALVAERNVFAGGPVVVFIWLAEPGWPVEYVSSNVQDVLGFSVADFVDGRLVFASLIHPEDYARISEEVTQYVATGVLRFEQEYRLRDASGRYRWFYDYTNSRCDASGQVDRFHGYLVDLSERKRVEGETQCIRERLELTLKGADLGMWDWNVQTGQVVMNERWAEILGFTLADIAPHISSLESRLHPDDAGRVGEAMLAHFEGKTPLFEAEMRLKTKEGGWRWVLSRGKLVERDAKNRPLRATGAIRDVTDRKEAERELTQAKKELENNYAKLAAMADETRQALLRLEDTNRRLEESMAKADAANRAKSEFLANMSHEIRSPLNAIVGFANLALKTGVDPRMASYISKINAASRTLLGLVNDILDFSKIEAQKLELENVEFSLSELVQRLADMFSFTLGENGLGFRVELDKNAPRFLRGDPLRLEQVLINLAQNAIKFTEKGGVELRIESKERTGERTLLAFTVADTGVGIAAEAIPFIFDPFTQAESSTSRRFGGAGLGLAISRHLVELMGGVLSVSSEVGKGSSFSFELFFERSSEDDARAAVQKTKGRSPLDYPGGGELDRAGALHAVTSVAIPSFAGARILVVEDHPINQQVAKETLEVAHFTVDLASNGEEALAALLAAKYDAVLMDVQMPLMDGQEATRRIRQHAQLQSLPIIAMTARVTPEDREACFASGMSDFVAKPFDFDSLFATLAKWVVPGTILLQFARQGLSAEVAGLAAQYAHAGLHVRDGVQRTAGKLPLYVKLLGDFVENHAQDDARFARARELGDLPALLRILHKLKSVSGVIGARRLDEVVSKLGRAENNDAPGRAYLEREFAIVFKQSLQAASSFIADMEALGKSKAAEQASAPQPESLARFKQTLAALRVFLLEGNMRAEDCLDELKTIAPPEIPGYLIAGVASHLRRFDMDAAVPLVDEIGRILEAPHDAA